MNTILPSIAVIIVNYNGAEHIVPCLRALEKQTHPANRVLVVDNNSSDGSADLVSENFPEIELIREPTNSGFAAANNHAIWRIEDCQWIALLNPDTVADPDWLESLGKGVIEFPDTQIFSSRLVDAKNPDRLDGTGDIYHVSGLGWRRDHGAPVNRSRSIEEGVFSPCGAAALYNIDWVKRVGGFDPDYFCYNEDTDLAFRMRLRGAKCLHLDHCRVHHTGSGITGRNSDFTVYHGHRNLVWTYFKNMPGSMFWWYLPQHLLLNLITIIYFTFKGRPGIILKAKWHALRGLPGILRMRREIQQSRTATADQLKSAMTFDPLAPYFKRHV